MHRRNGSLLAFRPTRASSAPVVTPRAPATNGANAAATAPSETAVVHRAHVDCPRCRLPITVESLRWQPVGDGDDAPGDTTDRMMADEYAAIRDGERRYRAVIHDLERRLLGRALHESGGVMKDAARILGIKYTTFVAKAHRLGLKAEED